jgi:hypothetical protein
VAAETPEPVPSPPPRPKQVAFTPERPVVERKPAPAPQPGLMQQWWVWLAAAIVLVILAYWILGS